MVCSVQAAIESWLSEQPLPEGWAYDRYDYIAGSLCVDILNDISVPRVRIKLWYNMATVSKSYYKRPGRAGSHCFSSYPDNIFRYCDPAFPDNLLEYIRDICYRE